MHQLVSGNVASMASNFGGCRHRHLALSMTDEEYMELPPHNPGNYPHRIGSSQEQAIGTEKFQQNQALFQNYTVVNGALKKQIVTAVEPVFLCPLVDQLTFFGQFSALTMMQHIFSSYGEIDIIDLKENAVTMMRP